MSHRVTFICDGCNKQFMIDEAMDMPPYWIAIQVAIADKDGVVPNHERDVFSHFCSQECVVEYAQSNELKERTLTVDRHFDDDEEDHDNNKEVM